MEAIKNQSVYFWGMFNDKEHPIPEKVKELQNKGVINVASGGFFFLAVSSQGELYAWGNCKYSRFGINSPQNITIPRIVPLKFQVRQIAAGNWHSVIIDSNHKAYAVGHNKSGACGLGSFQNAELFTEMKLQQPVAKISTGDCFSLLCTTDGDLYSCGHSSLHGHKKNEHLHTPKKLPFDQKIQNAAAGFSHALAATTSGLVYSWGKNECFQLGHGNKAQCKQPTLVKKLQGIKIIQVSCTRGQKNAHSMAVAADGSLYTWGAGYKGKLGHQSKWTHQNAADQPQPRKVQHIQSKIIKASAGGIHSNVLSQDGQILSFGCGSNGRLGHIQSNQYKYLYRQGFPRAIDSLKDTFVTNLQSSYYHNICIGFKRK